MNKQNLDQEEIKIIKQAEKREKKRKTKMVVSGASVKKLGEIIKKGR